MTLLKQIRNIFEIIAGGPGYYGGGPGYYGGGPDYYGGIVLNFFR